MEKKKYVKPVLETEEFVPQEYCTACGEYQSFGSADSGGVVLELLPKPFPNPDNPDIKYEYVQVATVNSTTVCKKGIDNTVGLRKVYFSGDQPSVYYDTADGRNRLLVDGDLFKIDHEGYTDFVGYSPDLMRNACFYRKPTPGEIKNLS